MKAFLALLVIIFTNACDAWEKHTVLHEKPPIYSNGHGNFAPSIPPSIGHGNVLQNQGYRYEIPQGVGIGPGVGFIGENLELNRPSYDIAAGHGHGPIHYIHRTIVDRVIPVPVPVPQPIPVTRKIPVSVSQAVPIEVKRPVPVLVPHPIPVNNKPNLVNVPRPVPVSQSVHVSHPVSYPIPVSHPVHALAPAPLPQSLPIGFNQYPVSLSSQYPVSLPSQTVQPIAPIEIGQTGTVLGNQHNSGFVSSNGIVNSGEQSTSLVSLPNSELHLSVSGEQSDEGYSYPVPAKKFI